MSEDRIDKAFSKIEFLDRKVTVIEENLKEKVND